MNRLLHWRSPNAYALCLLILVLPLAIEAKSIEGIVSKVSDGDTVWVKPQVCAEPPECKHIKIRMFGIDAPERCQPWGSQSFIALRDRLLNQRVVVTYSSTDRYGRALGRVWLGSEDIGAWMVSQGYAWSFGKSKRNLGPYASEHTQALQAGKGLFSDSRAQEPRVFRQSHGPCKKSDYS